MGVISLKTFQKLMISIPYFQSLLNCTYAELLARVIFFYWVFREIARLMAGK